MDRRFSPFLSIAFSTLLFAFLCGEATASQEQPDDLERIQDRGRLIVCSYPLIDSPFIRPLEDGAGWTGIDYELMTALATDLGTDLELVIPEDEEGLPSFTAVLPWLLDERCDIVAASLSVTPDRQKQVTFSKAYHRNHMHVVMRPGLCIDNVAELRDRVAAVIPGTVLEPWAAALHLGSTLTAIDQLTIDNLRDDGKLRTSAVD
ncbi:MAG: transporter substrate-binding domain-containing protein, partial [Acidobacteriota bacterium]